MVWICDPAPLTPGMNPGIAACGLFGVAAALETDFI